MADGITDGRLAEIEAHANSGPVVSPRDKQTLALCRALREEREAHREAVQLLRQWRAEAAKPESHRSLLLPSRTDVFLDRFPEGACERTESSSS